MIKKYRKKPTIVEAVQWKGDNYDEIINLAKENCEFVYNPDDYYELYIETPYGRVQVEKGDFIVKSKGSKEILSYREETFKEIYKEV